MEAIVLARVTGGSPVKTRQQHGVRQRASRPGGGRLAARKRAAVLRALRRVEEPLAWTASLLRCERPCEGRGVAHLGWRDSGWTGRDAAGAKLLTAMQRTQGRYFFPRCLDVCLLFFGE